MIKTEQFWTNKYRKQSKLSVPTAGRGTPGSSSREEGIAKVEYAPNKGGLNIEQSFRYTKLGAQRSKEGKSTALWKL